MLKSLLSLATACAIALHSHAQTGCEGDISGDGRTDGVDLAIVLTNWGVCSPASSIDGVYPSSGPVAGGTAIAIVGVDLSATASVTIGGVLVPSFNVVSATTVIAVTPAGGVGPKTLVLRNSQGQQVASGSFLYTVTSLPWATVIEQEPDPAVVTNPALRTAIAATGLPWRVRDTGTGIEMLLVPPGNFSMGCSPALQFPCSTIESPVHSVAITNPVYIGRNEVSQAQWQARMGANPSYFQPPSASLDLTRPVERVSWNMIAGPSGFLSGTGLRLPSEAEWEFTYRAGTTTAYHGFLGLPEGSNDGASVASIAWYYDNTCAGSPCCGAPCGTRASGLKAANGLGFFDMSGNVWEWVSDWYSSTYYASSPLQNPPGPPTGVARVLRGGSWRFDPHYQRSSSRGFGLPDRADDDFGFRVARNP